MYHTQEHSSGLGIFLFDIVLDNIRKGAIASLVALYDLPTPFIYNDDMVVFVNDLHNYQLSIVNYQLIYIFIPPSTWITCPLT